MSAREVTVWLDERWYDALSRRLENETVEDKLGEHLDAMIDQLPKQVREKISREIREEQQRHLQKLEAAKVFTAFRVREGGQELCFRVERDVEFPDAARMLRRYLRGESGAESNSFAELFRDRELIDTDVFNGLVALRMENTGKVAGAFELDFDRQEFSALSIMDGWKTWTMMDVSAAAYHAFRKIEPRPERRLDRLLDKLEGRELTWLDRPTDPEEAWPEEAPEPEEASRMESGGPPTMGMSM